MSQILHTLVDARKKASNLNKKKNSSSLQSSTITKNKNDGGDKQVHPLNDNTSSNINKQFLLEL